ncbi:glycosyltransferase family 2 protein [Niabella aquatica]
MKSVSVVILTKNAAATIASAVSSALQVSDDVIVVDSHSTDSTVDIAARCGAKTINITWCGYGNARNHGAEIAQHPFILNIDADEVITKLLADEINRLVPEAATIYGFKRLNHLGTKKIIHGEWGNDRVWRLYNKNETRWNLDEVHETLNCAGFHKVLLHGTLKHFTAENIRSYNRKMDGYARLSAKKYLEQHKRVSTIKTIVSPVFNLVKNYIFRLGILDGREGWEIAKAHYWYNRNKYRYLRHLKQAQSETASVAS